MDATSRMAVARPNASLAKIALTAAWLLCGLLGAGWVNATDHASTTASYGQDWASYGRRGPQGTARGFDLVAMALSIAEGPLALPAVIARTSGARDGWLRPGSTAPRGDGPPEETVARTSPYAMLTPDEAAAVLAKAVERRSETNAESVAIAAGLMVLIGGTLVIAALDATAQASWRTRAAMVGCGALQGLVGILTVLTLAAT